jgi:hypothetical protein
MESEKDMPTYYYKYWQALLGYDIQSRKTGIIYTKGQFWERFRSVCIKYVETERMNKDFRIIKK